MQKEIDAQKANHDAQILETQNEMEKTKLKNLEDQAALKKDMENAQQTHLEEVKNTNTKHLAELESLRVKMQAEIDRELENMENQRKQYEATLQEKENEQ